MQLRPLALLAALAILAGCPTTPVGSTGGGAGASSGQPSPSGGRGAGGTGAPSSRPPRADAGAPSAGSGGASAPSSLSDAGAPASGTSADAGTSGASGASSAPADDGGMASSPLQDAGSATPVRPFTCAAPGAPSSCGNGVVDPGEACDGQDLRGLTCTLLDPFFTAGTLACATNCTLVTTACTHGTCGNGVIDPGEDCEYANFSPFPCNTLISGSDNALVACSASTCRYDTSNCAAVPAPTCGNGKRESGEQCDGDDRLFRSCSEHLMETQAGQLRCDQATCQLDYTACERCDGTRCGDGHIDVEEECDGSNLGTHSCADQNRIFGTVSCLENCRVDYSQCHGGCTVFKGTVTCN